MTSTKSILHFLFLALGYDVLNQRRFRQTLSESCSDWPIMTTIISHAIAKSSIKVRIGINHSLLLKLLRSP